MRGPGAIARANHDIDGRQLRGNVRKDSRTWRFTRLRATELPTAFLPIDSPTRG